MFLSIKKANDMLIGSKITASLSFDNEIHDFEFVIEKFGDSLVLSDNGRAIRNLHADIKPSDFCKFEQEHSVYVRVIGELLCCCLFIAPTEPSVKNEYLQARVKRLAQAVYAFENNILKF